MPTTWFTADEHFGHKNIIEYADRPFASVEEMDEEIIRRHNAVVGDQDTVIHVGDFTLRRKFQQAASYFDRLKGRNHVFIPGSHDVWMDEMSGTYGFPLPFYRKEGEERTGGFAELRHGRLILLVKHGRQEIVCCHYAMRTWPKAHYGTWHVYGHSHGKLPNLGKSWDVGVDNNNFAPVSFEQLRAIMDKNLQHTVAKRRTR